VKPSPSLVAHLALAGLFSALGVVRAAEQDAGFLPPATKPSPRPGGEASPESPAGPSVPGSRATIRDPFRPFHLEVHGTEAREPKTPLERYDLGSLTLVAVIWNVSDPKAMVEDDSGLGYTIGIGTPIGRNGGIVRRIEPDRVIVEEEFVDFYGEKKKKEVVLKLKTEGEKRP
jgi:Tfp pilus assembly protein PilP